jgi:signal peptidase I
MNFWKRRRYRKAVKHLLREARHARYMREDVAGASPLEALARAESELRRAWDARDEQGIDDAAERLQACARAVYPERPHAKVRENLEILVVALAVAMACRTYFIQPFKIPTGSMQPTLFGIHYEPRDGRGLMDTIPFSLVNLALFGARYEEVRAKVSGRVEIRKVLNLDHDICLVDRVEHYIPKGMRILIPDGTFVAKNQALAAGRVYFGDHIFVDKVRYNFARPKRGNIFVFSTDGIQHPDIKQNTFYIKRLVGLPGERVSIEEPHLVINGLKIAEPYPFYRLLHDPNYPGGYRYARHPFHRPYLAGPGDQMHLADDQYLPMGDNTGQSLDGRYFGSVPERNIVGPAFCVYWPISKRWGIVR